jgi:uncharacterized protein (DUF58 family)
VSTTRYRVTFLLLGLALALVIVFAVVWAPGGREFRLPPAVDSISPSNGETVLRQIDLRIDMRVGYNIELFVDGVRIPDDEIAHTPATGRYVWVPGPAKTFADWTLGTHSVGITYERAGGRVDAGTLSWVFRVQ